MIRPTTTTKTEVRPTAGLKTITVRKAGPVRLTGAAHPLYGGCVAA
jgi:hypothetical protein